MSRRISKAVLGLGESNINFLDLLLAMGDRLSRELITERDRTDKQRSEDRNGDGDRLDRIETDIRSMRDTRAGHCGDLVVA